MEIDKGAGISQKEKIFPIIIPEKLPLSAHLLDQPPFTWAREDPSLIPEDFFSRPEGWYGFCRTVLYRQTPFDRDNVSRKQWWNLLQTLRSSDCINREQYPSERIFEIGAQLRNWFEANYPFIKDYIERNKNDYVFGGVNPRRRIGGKWRTPTYAAYLHDRIAREKRAPWFGLVELLPAEYSTIREIQEAIPPKSPVNRIFRLRKILAEK